MSGVRTRGAARTGATTGATPGARLSGVPSSYWYYLSNQGFFWGIFRDINPIATRQAWGWEFRGFLAWSFGRLPWFSAFILKRRARVEEDSCLKRVPGKDF